MGSDRLSIGRVEVDLVRRRIRLDGTVAELTALEARLLRYLAARPHADVPRSELLDKVWGYSPTASTRAVDFVVSRLRSKLGEAGRTHLLTSHGVGYRLVHGTEGRMRLPSGVVDPVRRRFVPDQGDPVDLTLEQVELLLRLTCEPVPA